MFVVLFVLSLSRLSHYWEPYDPAHTVKSGVLRMYVTFSMTQLAFSQELPLSSESSVIIFLLYYVVY